MCVGVTEDPVSARRGTRGQARDPGHPAWKHPSIIIELQLSALSVSESESFPTTEHAANAAVRQMFLLAVLVALLSTVLTQSFIVPPVVTSYRRTVNSSSADLTSMSSSTDKITTPASTPAGAGSSTGAVGAGKSQLQIRNEKEGYDLNGVLTVKREDSRSVWVLCHGLCSSSEGTVSRFVSEELDGNTFRQASDLQHRCSRRFFVPTMPIARTQSRAAVMVMVRNFHPQIIRCKSLRVQDTMDRCSGSGL